MYDSLAGCKLTGLCLAAGLAVQVLVFLLMAGFSRAQPGSVGGADDIDFNLVLPPTCPETRTPKEGCQVKMNGGLPDPQPVILNPDVATRDGFAFKLPTTKGTLVFKHGDAVRLVCAGPNNRFKNLEAPSDIIISCYERTIFSFDGTLYDFKHFNCKADAKSATKEGSGGCNVGEQCMRTIKVGFEVQPDQFFEIMEICFDHSTYNSLWSKYDLVKEIEGMEYGLDKPETFTVGPYYPQVTQLMNVNALYSRKEARKTLARYIGQQNANKFIEERGDIYLSRGHLTPAYAFLYNVQKKATFELVNVAPQWYKFNSETWKQVEIEVKNFASSRLLNLVVYTGTHGQTTLPDAKGKEQKLRLWDYGSELISVPAFFWKVVYDPVNKMGIVMVGINNPHKDFKFIRENFRTYMACPGKTISSNSSWSICRQLSVNKEAQENGYGYCCKLEDFSETVRSLPEMDVSGGDLMF